MNFLLLCHIISVKNKLYLPEIYLFRLTFDFTIIEEFDRVN